MIQSSQVLSGWSSRGFVAWCALVCLQGVTAVGCSEPTSVAGDEAVEEIRSALTSGAAKIACGGPAVSPFIADTDFTGGAARTRTNTIDVSAVYNPAPTAVYQSQRYGNFTYTVPGFTAGSWNQVRLHFADTHWTTAGARTFNVTINGKQVLTSFDIVKTAGAGNKALIEQFTMPADSSGQYVIAFQTVIDAASVSGIEVAPASLSGTPTTVNGTSYAKQCAQQLVPLPPNFGGGGTAAGTCADCFTKNISCINCTAGLWKYAGQVTKVDDTNVRPSQSFNGNEMVDLFYWEAPATTPGMCMMAARHSGDFQVDFHGVICQSAKTGAACFWDEASPDGSPKWSFQGGTGAERGHVVIPATAMTVTSTTSIPSPPAFVGGSDLVFTSANPPTHSYQNECSDCHSGRNLFNNHPGTATDVFGRGLVSATSYFPMPWPSPIVPAWDPGAAALGKPWARNPPPQTGTFSNSSCSGCHTEAGLGSNPATSGGLFTTPSELTPFYCATMLREATHRTNNDCPGTWPWANGDISCPSGAMPPSSSAGPNSDTDGFAIAMLKHQTGSCYADFRTQFLAPKGTGVTLTNAAGTLSTAAYLGFQPAPPSNQAVTAGVDSTGKVRLYDPTGMKWVTTTQTASQVSVGANNGIWTLRQSGTSSFVCAANGDQSCTTTGTCTWTCDSQSSRSYVSLVAGSGVGIWALDSGRHIPYRFISNGPGNYTPNGFIALGDFTDQIAQIASGGDDEAWLLMTNGVLYRQTNGLGSGAWAVMPAPPATPVSLSVANASDIWVGTSSGLYRFVSATNSWERHCLTGGCTGSNAISFTAVSAGGETNADTTTGLHGTAEVWGMDASGNAYRVDRTKATATNSITKITGATFTRLVAGGPGDVMGINSSGSVFSFQ